MGSMQRGSHIACHAPASVRDGREPGSGGLSDWPRGKLDQLAALWERYPPGLGFISIWDIKLDDAGHGVHLFADSSFDNCSSKSIPRPCEEPRAR